jgi:hypothetical protein
VHQSRAALAVLGHHGLVGKHLAQMGEPFARQMILAGGERPPDRHRFGNLSNFWRERFDD